MEENIGEDILKLSNIYAVDNDTGKAALLKVPKISKGGYVDNYYVDKSLGDSFECTIKLTTISKKRFIKLLMGEGFQRNEAILMHNAYMKEHNTRTMLGFVIFKETYWIEYYKKE